MITKNFSLAELTHSDTAKARGISNVPSEAHKANLVASAKNLWQPARDILGVPMIVSSGYRPPELNRASERISNIGTQLWLCN